jgi:NTE family protein
LNWIDKLVNRKPKIGVALSGGATLGAAHIGVLQVLEREGIRPDFVAGTSAGALVGAVYCAGVPLDELENIFINMKWPTIIRLAITTPLSLFDMQPIDSVITKIIGEVEFKDLEIPFAAIACDLVTGKRIVLDRGPVAPAIRASASVPGIFKPVEIDGNMLVDGGVVDNLPVDQIRAMGAKFTIASDVSNRGESTQRPENIFEVLQTMFNIMQDRGALITSDECDCYIRPNVTQYSCWGFSDGQKILEEGKKAAENALPKLLKQLHR